MTKIALALIVAATLQAGPHRAILAAAQEPAAAQDHAHAGIDHGGMPPARFESPTNYRTLNIDISDAGIEPATVFIPAGQAIQLMLRNRGSREHHYRVVGLVPDDLVWVSRAESAQQNSAADAEHNHHNRQIVRERATSPGGIRPSGREVHAYAPGGSGVDVVLFRATQTGTFIVQCDLHPEKAGKLVVFDGGGAAPAEQVSPRRRQALAHALSRDLGPVDYPGAPGVLVEATYATRGVRRSVARRGNRRGGPGAGSPRRVPSDRTHTYGEPASGHEPT